MPFRQIGDVHPMYSDYTWNGNRWVQSYVHPYERLFAKLREVKGQFCVDNCGQLRHCATAKCPIAQAADCENREAEEYGVDRFGLCGSHVEAIIHAADGCCYNTYTEINPDGTECGFIGCGHHHLAKKLYHYLTGGQSFGPWEGERRTIYES